MVLQFFLLLLIALFSSMNGEESPQTLVIVTYKVGGAEPWDPSSIHKGVTGSEEAVIYMSQELAELGYKVTVLGNPPKDSPFSAPESNPRFVDFGFNDGTRYDIGIAWRTPFNAAAIKSFARAVYLWPHDIYDEPLSTQEIHGFDGVLWISKWQRDYWISINPPFAKFDQIFGNGVNLCQFQPLEERKNPFSCIYGSNYARGLDVLLDVWPQIKAKYPLATLDIYYGWQHWGLLSAEKEKKMRLQINFYKSLGVQEHGLVSHEELNKAYARSSLWTYPCTDIEVFCITAIRAQLSGAVPVIIESAALPETVRHGYKCTKTEEYLDLLDRAMGEATKISVEERQKMGEFIKQEYTWKAIATKWKAYFDRKP